MKEYRLEDEFNVEDRDEVYKKHPHFPSHLLTADVDDVPYVVIGTGGDGKTFNEMKTAIKRFQDPELGIHNLSGFFYPTKAEVEQIIADASLFDKLLDNEESAEKYGEFVNKLTYNRDWIYHDGKPFCRLYAISMHAKYKAQDHTRIGNIWMDEFQRENYLKNEAFKIQDLIATIKRKKKSKYFRCVFTSNAISLASPITRSLGIYHIDKHSDYVDEEGTPDYSIVTRITNKKGLLMSKVVYWKRPVDQVDAQYETDDPFMAWFELSGYKDYRFGNKFKNDNMTNIMGEFETEDLQEFGELKHIFEIEQGFFVEVWMIPPENNVKNMVIWYVKKREKTNKSKDVTQAILQEFAGNSILYNPNWVTKMARKSVKNQLEFDSISTSQMIHDIVKSYY